MFHCVSRKHTAAGNERLLQIAAVNPQSTVAIVTMTRTPNLQTRRSWQNHLPNKNGEVCNFFQNG
jgi:hypothetical protein